MQPSHSFSGGSVYCAHLFAFNLSAAGQSAKERSGIWQAIFHMTPKQCVPSARQASRPGPAFGKVLSEMQNPHISLSFPFEEWLYFPIFGRLWKDEVMCLLHGWMNLWVLSIFSSTEFPGFAFLSREGHFLNSVSGFKWYSSVVQIYLFIWGRKEKSKHKINLKRQEDVYKRNFKV